MSNKTEELKGIMNEIGKHAVRLHQLMKEGTIIDIVFPEEAPILIPNQPPKLKHLLIIKPEVYASIQLTPIKGNTN